MKAQSLFTLLQMLHGSDLERLRIITRRVKHLCTVVEGSWSRMQCQRETPPISETEEVIPIWNLIPFFTNLQSLELHGSHVGRQEYERPIPHITAPSLADLRFAKL
jgi:hypothetical protein